MRHTDKHTLTDTIMHYLFKFACPTQSHTFPGVASVHRGYLTVKYHSEGKEKNTIAIELVTQREYSVIIHSVCCNGAAPNCMFDTEI